MAFAQGSRSRLAFIEEVTFGTTPSSPSMVQLPINTHSLELKKSVIESGEIRGDRQVHVSRHGNKSVAGDISVEMRADDFDLLLEGALFGDFTTNVLKLGTTFKSFTFEDGMLDISRYRTFVGCAITGLSIEVKPDAMVMTTFSVIGKNGPAASATALDAAVTAASSNEPFDSFSGTISEGGTPIATITSLNLTIDNGIQPTMVIGADTPPQLEYGRGKVSGEIVAYFDAITLYNKYVNETVSDITFTLTDGLTGNTYTFDLPKVKFNSGSMPLQNEQSRLLTMQIQALYNSGDATSLSITRS